MTQEIQNGAANDPIASMLERYAQNILVVIFGLLPLFFLPMQVAPFEYTKIFFVIVGVVAALILFSLSVLRNGKIAFRFSYTLGAFWLIAIIAVISGALSGDLRDALIGDQLGIHTAAFIGVLALIMSVWSLLTVNKAAIMRLYILLAASTLLLVIFHLIRLVFGAEVLTFGVFQGLVSSPIGSWNDLALFLGLSVILSLVALEQLPLTKPGKLLFGVVTIVALCMLAIINFFTVWLVLGLVSLVMLVYTVGKNRLDGSQMSLIAQKSSGVSSLSISLIVFVISVLFVIGGSTLGGFISKYTGISYIEVRPSLGATTDIARQVYEESPLLGIGTNRFTDAWRLYKDPSINSTMFWNTEFIAGNGYLTTFFVTMGILGGLAWVAFFVLFAVSGVRFLMTVSDADRMWYFIGLSSFVSALYIWGMSIVYVPGAVILLLGALCTGITLAAQGAMGALSTRSFSIINNRRAGFVLTLLVIALIVGSVSILYSTGRHYGAVYAFNESNLSLQEGSSIDEVSSKIEDAYQLSGNDMYARRIAEYKLTRMGQLLAVVEPSVDEQKEFETALVDAVSAGTRATEVDATEPTNWAILGAIYNVLVTENKESVYDRALEALTKAKDLDPKNPSAYLSLAIFEARAGNLESSRGYAEQAVTLKPNYVDAYFFLSQLDINSGDIPAAIESSQAMISLEPQNPSRYYQLGVLESAVQNVEAATVAFERAVQLDPNFANARYLLALNYDILKRPQEAKAQLEKVLELNPGNESVLYLLDALKNNKSLAEALTPPPETPAVNEASKVTEDNGTVITDEEPDTPLVSPVNTAPEVQTEE